MAVRRYISGLIGAVLLSGFLPAGGAVVPPPVSEEDTLRSPLYAYTEGIKRLHVRRDSVGAREEFVRAVELDTNYAPAWYELASLTLPDDPAKASEQARRACGLDTANRFYLTLYAQSLVMDRKIDPALAAYRKLIRLESRNPDNYRMAALLAQSAGRSDEALSVLDSAETMFGRNGILNAIKRHILIEQGQYDRALEEAKAMVEAVPYEAEGYQALGDIYLMTGADSLGLAALNRALEIDSTHIETLVSLADYYNGRREYGPYFAVSRRIFEHPALPLEEKVRIYKRYTGDLRFYREFYPQIGMLARTLAMLYPKDPAVVELYADHLIATGDVEQAGELYKMRLGDQPPQLDYYQMVIDIESYLQRPDSADRYLARAIELFPDRADLYIRRGHLAGGLQADYDRAEAYYRKGFELAESDSLRSAVWGFVGDLYQQRSQGDLGSAEEAFARRDNGRGTWRKWIKKCYAAYDKALRYDRDNVSVLNNYAYFLSLDGRDLNRALEMSSRAVALTDNNPTYLDTYAWVLFKLGRLEEAKRYLQQAVAFDGRKSPELLIHYGDVLAALGEKFMAETYWKKALENGYDPKEVELRIRRMKNPDKP